MSTPVISARGFPSWVKDPAAVKDYSLDWTAWLAGDSVATSQWAAQNGITVNTSAQVGAVMTVWLSGGTLGQSYLVTNRITTTNVPPRTDERTIEIVCKNQ